MLPVVMNNLAYFYYRKHKYPAAHSYMTKAMTLERKAYGAVDFATHLRMAAVSARLSHHTVSLKHCKAALKVLQEAADLHGGHGGAPAAARTYHAHLAVVYHNLAVQMAYLQQLQHAAGTAKVAQQLVTQALPAKHRWVRCPPAHACALDAHHCLRTACALPAHCMRTACALHAHCRLRHPSQPHPPSPTIPAPPSQPQPLPGPSPELDPLNQVGRAEQAGLEQAEAKGAQQAEAEQAASEAQRAVEQAEAMVAAAEAAAAQAAERFRKLKP